MSHPDTSASPQHIQALAQSILELSKTYEPTPLAGSDGSEPEIVKKAKELIAAVQTPMDHVMSMIFALAEPYTMRTLMSFKALQAIPTDGSITVEELETVTGVQAALLQRFLRLLAGTGFLACSSDGSTPMAYAHTTLSRNYATTTLGTLFSVIFDEMAVMARYPEYFASHGAREPDGEMAMTHNPQTWALGQEGKTIFEILEQTPEKLKDFQVLMGLVGPLKPYTGFYDFGKLVSASAKDGIVLVDVGGGKGDTIAKILEAHPTIRPEQCVLQDRARVIELARSNHALPEGVQLQAHDFFTPQPVKKAGAYLLRAICHDWSDAMVVKILSNIVTAMGSESKVLIAEAVLPAGGVSGMQAFLDMIMLTIGGKERTRKDFEKVLDAAGLKLEGIYTAPGALGFGIVEASLK